jgi:hypothetical protein
MPLQGTVDKHGRAANSGLFQLRRSLSIIIARYCHLGKLKNLGIPFARLP